MINLYRNQDGASIGMEDARFKEVGRHWLNNGWRVVKETPKQEVKELINKPKPKPVQKKVRKKRVTKK